ncbi:hypothetical protein CANARDRAFT_30617 [[Candida] arabinofermentans NRRL YB-2248]|uniref:Uncharacterized protein n=1 Tax=[Candida] arabinofermentans NRRL YB-2248 TaxID=983967 RepID=A0A1E4STC9_9ASCO|nr:hypothetical protein CANARDRAFT_30617 [[Candida] arabinofermentans NRRL YB-2248]
MSYRATAAAIRNSFTGFQDDSSKRSSSIDFKSMDSSSDLFYYTSSNISKKIINFTNCGNDLLELIPQIIDNDYEDRELAKQLDYKFTDLKQLKFEIYNEIEGLKPSLDFSDMNRINQINQLSFNFKKAIDSNMTALANLKLNIVQYCKSLYVASNPQVSDSSVSELIENFSSSNNQRYYERALDDAQTEAARGLIHKIKFVCVDKIKIEQMLGDFNGTKEKISDVNIQPSGNTNYAKQYGSLEKSISPPSISQVQARKKRRTRMIISLVIFGILTIIGCVAGAVAAKNHSNNNDSDSSSDTLSNQVAQAAPYTTTEAPLIGDFISSYVADAATTAEATETGSSNKNVKSKKKIKSTTVAPMGAKVTKTATARKHKAKATTTVAVAKATKTAVKKHKAKAKATTTVAVAKAAKTAVKKHKAKETTTVAVAKATKTAVKKHKAKATTTVAVAKVTKTATVKKNKAKEKTKSTTTVAVAKSKSTKTVSKPKKHDSSKSTPPNKKAALQKKSKKFNMYKGWSG